MVALTPVPVLFVRTGVREALDAKGEWWVDVATDTLYIIPNATATATDGGGGATTLSVIVRSLGERIFAASVFKTWCI